MFSNILFFIYLLWCIEYCYTFLYNIKYNNNNNIQSSLFFTSFLCILYTYIYIIKLNIYIIINKFIYCYIILLLQNSISNEIISLLFILLTVVIFFLCTIYNSEVYIYNINNINIIYILLEIILILIFLCNNILYFYIMFEISLIPTIIIILVLGSRQRKIHSMYYLYCYTLIGSLFFFIALIYIYVTTGSFSSIIINNFNFTFFDESVLFILLFFSFAIKVPLWPLHIWLPEAHVESPTTGSVILAGILLKLGTYGMLKFLLPLTKHVIIFYIPMIHTICIIGIVFSSILILRIIDIKKIIAYSSIIHMSVLMIGLFSNNPLGVTGSLFMMINHGIVSGGLFFAIGVIYDRYHTRLIYYYRGLSKVMPIYNFILFILILSNMGLPLTSSFVAECLIISGTCFINSISAAFICISCIFSTVYNVLLYSRIMLGDLNILPKFIYYYDLSEREMLVFLPLIIFILLLGICPTLLFSMIHQTDSIIFL